MNKAITYFTDIPVFSTLSEKEETLLAHAACRKKFAAGTVIFEINSHVQFLAIISRGRAISMLQGNNGGEVIVDFYVAGDIIGDINFSENIFHSSNIVSLEATEIIFIARHSLLQLIRQNSQMAAAFAEMSAMRVKHINQRLSSLALQQGEDRIITFFADLMTRFGYAENEEQVLQWSLSHQLVAAACGMTRENVSRLISGLSAKGILIRQQNGWKLMLKAD